MKIFALTLLFAISVSAETVRNENLGTPQTEATSPVIFPHTGGTGSFSVTTSTGGSYSVTSTNISITDQATTGNTIKVSYAVAPTKDPQKASITITVAGYAPQTLNVNIAGEGAVSSSASYSPGKVAHGALTTFWGSRLATLENAATTPLPTILGGAKIFRQAFATSEWTECPLLYTSPSQINFHLPDSDAYGMYIFYALSPGGDYYSAFANVSALAPDVYTINSSGTEYDQATITIQRGTTYESPKLSLDPYHKWVMEPVTTNSETYLLFYASGTRKDISMAACYAIIDDTKQIPLVYAGPQGQYVGLDQIAIRSSEVPSGTHKIQFVINGWRSNAVRIAIQ